MRTPAVSELLSIWERGLSQASVQRALTILATACPEEPPDSLAQQSIGQRNALLLALREQIFGERFVGVAFCPACGEQLELSFATSDIRASPEAEPAQSLSLDVSGYEVHFRLPNSTDLAAAQEQADTALIRQMLLERCLLSAHHRDEALVLEELPAEVVDAIVETMDQADPQANVQLALTCPACAHQWPAAFDILSYFWRELDAWAYRILRDVHWLASTYGWSEHEILNMSPWRRQVYLEMIG